LNDDNLVNYIPESFKTDDERFQGVRKLNLTCSACGVESEFPGILYPRKEDGNETGTLGGGFDCVNPACQHPQYWGASSPYEYMARIMNSMSVLVRQQLQDYYQGVIKCDDPACGLETRQLSVNGGVCLNRGCNGRMASMVKERSLQTQLKYFECLFDADHVCQQLEGKGTYGSKHDLEKYISKADRVVAGELRRIAKENVEECAYNWIVPSFWQSMFGAISSKQ
jgi:DNA polymerase alpha subunit A